MFNLGYVIKRFLELKKKGFEPDKIIQLLEDEGHNRSTIMTTMELLGYEVALWFGRPAAELCP